MRDGYYWFKSERSTTRAIGQLCKGQWYLINERGPFTIGEIHRRGWELDHRVKGN
jgi:hypothetical protein